MCKFTNVFFLFLCLLSQSWFFDNRIFWKQKVALFSSTLMAESSEYYSYSYYSSDDYDILGKEAEEEEEEEESQDEYEDWISQFCSEKKFKNWFCHVSEAYLDDPFNLFGLQNLFKHYQKALNCLLDVEEEDMDEKLYSDVQFTEEIQNLYLLVHQRYIQSPEGLAEMLDKYNRKVFGTCPRVECEKQAVIPYGMSTNLGVSGCLAFCPRCRDVYIPKAYEVSRIDGAAFGPNFAAILLSDPSLKLKIPAVKNPPLTIFGFRVLESRRRLDRTKDPSHLPEFSDASEYEEEEDYAEEENAQEAK